MQPIINRGMTGMYVLRKAVTYLKATVLLGHEGNMHEKLHTSAVLISIYTVCL